AGRDIAKDELGASRFGKRERRPPCPGPGVAGVRCRSADGAGASDGGENILVECWNCWRFDAASAAWWHWTLLRLDASVLVQIGQVRTGKHDGISRARGGVPTIGRWEPRSHVGLAAADDMHLSAAE